jgi:predicted PurR-regulated permease PerM
MLDKRAAQIIGTIVAFAAIAAFVYGARKTLVVFLFAVFFAYLLEPAVARLERSRISGGSRTRAILITYTILTLSLIVLVLTVGPLLVSETRNLIAALPALLQKLGSGKLVSQIGSSRGWSEATELKIQHYLAGHRREVLTWVQQFARQAAPVLADVVWVVVIPILAVFFLKDGSEFAETLIAAVDRRRPRIFLRGVLNDMNEMLAGYIRAQLILAGIAVGYYVGLLAIMRVPYGIALGVVAGIMEFIPVLGPLVGAISILGVAFLTGYSHLLLLGLFLAGWRIVQDYVNAPRIMGGSLELHPLIAIFAVLAGAELAGIIGVYLSIPVAAALRILWRRWQAYSQPVTVPPDNLISKDIHAA